MNKKKQAENVNENNKEEEVLKEEKTEEKAETEEQGNKDCVPREEYEELLKKNEELSKNADTYKDMYQRLLAEFDNYKKRTIKERDANRMDAKIDIITKFLPVIDNIERAESSFEKNSTTDTLKQGVQMVFKQIMDVMESEGVTCIEAEGEEFDPQLHNAVMHVEDDKCDTNVIVEVFQKGYKCNEKVIRHSMVKVAN